MGGGGALCVCVCVCVCVITCLSYVKESVKGSIAAGSKRGTQRQDWSWSRRGFIWSRPGVRQGAGRRVGSFRLEGGEAGRLEVLIHRTKGKQKQDDRNRRRATY